MKNRWHLRSILRSMILNFLFVFPNKPVLRLLLRMDNWIYYLVGKVATRANGGIHPKHRFLKYHDFFIMRINPGDRVLDIGCGNGVVALEVAQKTGAEVTGVDSDPTKIAEAKQRDIGSQVNFIVGDVLQSLPGKKYDVVILSNVLEHLPDRICFLQTLVNTSRPSRLLIRVPLIDRDWRVALKQEMGIEWRLDPTHFIEYTLETFTDEIQSAKLKIDHMEVRWGEIWSENSPIDPG